MTIQNEGGAIFGRRVREVRRRRGWSQVDLARRLDELGRPMSQAVIARIEARRPGTRALKIALDDVLAIAAVLGVSPLFLFLPLEDSELVSIAPNLEVPARKARGWIRGDEPLRDNDDRRIFEQERDERSAAEIAAAKVAELRRQEALRELELSKEDEDKRLASQKRRRVREARMFLEETAAEITDLERAGEPVPRDLQRRHDRQRDALDRLESMTTKDIQREEDREAEAAAAALLNEYEPEEEL